MLVAELSRHLDTEAEQRKSGNYRNGSSRKTGTTPEGKTLELAIPRDRQATFEPRLVAKCQRRLPGFDERVISMHTCCMNVRKITGPSSLCLSLFCG
jgi:putative transposase